jgi:hypothetical protein
METNFKLDLVSNVQKEVIYALYEEIDEKISGYNHSLTSSLKEQED